MLTKLESLREEALQRIDLTHDEEELQQVRIHYLGKKGELTKILRGMGQLSAEERPKIGKVANEIRESIQISLESRLSRLREEKRAAKLAEETLDISLPGKEPELGHFHPLNLVWDEMVDIFLRMGFTVREGREIETDYYNFEALNIPKEHPARDMQDTFYISEDIVLRTHTSNMQIHTLEGLQPNEPVKVVCPGRVYRRDDDATHSPMFHQIEGLVVDKDITMGHLKGTLEVFFKEMFGSETQIRLRPSYFPFVEPGAEVDVSCVFCKGEGCSTCKGTGWIELLGAGMVHPNVLKMAGYDPEKVSGFAFGMGIDRITMLKLGISDLRYLFANDVRMLQQF